DADIVDDDVVDVEAAIGGDPSRWSDVQLDGGDEGGRGEQQRAHRAEEPEPRAPSPASQRADRAVRKRAKNLADAPRSREQRRAARVAGAFFDEIARDVVDQIDVEPDEIGGGEIPRRGTEPAFTVDRKEREPRVTSVPSHHDVLGRMTFPTPAHIIAAL